MPVATQTNHAGRQELTPAARKLIEDRAARAAAALNTPQDAPLFEEEAPAKAEKCVTFTIHGLMDDFPFDVQFTGSAEVFAATVKRLKDLGAVPPTAAARAAVAAEKERSAPICNCDTCDKYGAALEPSTKVPGTFYCQGKIGTKNGKPVYCKSVG